MPVISRLTGAQCAHKANMLPQGMEGANVGIWCAHGEGRAVFPDPAIHDAVLQHQLAPIRCSLPSLPVLSPQHPICLPGHQLLLSCAVSNSAAHPWGPAHLRT